MNKFYFLLVALALTLGDAQKAVAGGKIAAWGDSYTYGGGISLPEYAYPVQLQTLSGLQVYNGGVNGQTSTQIKTRMLAAADKQNYSAIIWVGNNNFWEPEVVKADIANMVAFLGHKRYLVISLLNEQDQPVGSSDYAIIIKLNNELKAIYGKNYLDVRSYLVSQSNGSAQDERDKANDVVPTSLRYDSSHPNDKGYKLVAEYINKNLALLTVSLTVAADAKSKVYGSADPALSYKLTGSLEPGDNFTGALTRTAGSNVGDYTVSQGTLTAGPYYTITFLPATFTITKAALTITADDKSRVQGAANPPFTASYSGFVNGETSAVLVAQPSFSTTATAASAPGTYPITVSGATTLNYNLTYVDGKLTVTSALPAIASFTPTTSATGATVTITGNYFTSATAVSFGGVPAASFTVVSPTSITAVVGAGASGSVSVSTAVGTGTLADYTFVPKPTITAAGQTTFASGGSVVLTASPGIGFTYKWAKDGVDIAGATAASFTATSTGAYTVAITANSVSQTSTAVSVTSVFVLPAANFKLTATNETCRTSNNGSINITAAQSRSYTAVLTGNSLNVSKPFTTTVDFTDLQAATYNVCITVAGESAYKQCFDVVITEPKDLAVFAVVNKDSNSITLALDGSSLYIIELNGSSFKTNQSNVTLGLKPGDNIIKVFTGTICQGSFEKHITLFDKPVVYPNPFEDVLTLSNLPAAKTTMEIRALDGRLVFKESFNNETGSISLGLGTLDAGIYILKASSTESESVYKIIKK